MEKIEYPESGDITYVYGGPEETALNQAGRIVRITDEHGTVEYEYGNLGETVRERRRIQSKTDSLGAAKQAEMTYRSDYLGRMQSITYPDGETIEYGYTYGGEVESVSGQAEQ